MEEHIAIQLVDSVGSIRIQVFAGTAIGKELYVRGLDTGDLPTSQVWDPMCNTRSRFQMKKKGTLWLSCCQCFKRRGVNSQKTRMQARKRTCCVCCTLSTRAAAAPSMSSKPWWRRRTLSTPSGGGEAAARGKISQLLKMTPAQQVLGMHLMSQHLNN